MNKVSFVSLFANPLMQVQLDLDLGKLTEFAFQLKNKDVKGTQASNNGGWQSYNIREEKHEEFEKLKKEINQYLQKYHSEIFRGMKFKEKNVIQNFGNMWININEQYHFNEWHIHGGSTLSGVYYIKHDGSVENGNIMFKHPNYLYLLEGHWPPEVIEETNEITTEIISIVPNANMLLIFPSWLEHQVEANLKTDSRISFSFNSFANTFSPNDIYRKYYFKNSNDKP